MCDAAGFVLLIEDYTEKDGASLKSVASVSFGSGELHVGHLDITQKRSHDFSTTSGRSVARPAPHEVNTGQHLTLTRGGRINDIHEICNIVTSNRATHHNTNDIQQLIVTLLVRLRKPKIDDIINKRTANRLISPAMDEITLTLLYCCKITGHCSFGNISTRVTTRQQSINLSKIFETCTQGRKQLGSLWKCDLPRTH